jgi:potassium-transporting ATPase KdpC subunit
MFSTLLKSFYKSVIATIVLAVILSGVYPLVVTGIGKLLFPSQASGGLITLPDGRVVGAKLIGQGFTKPEYFHGRPSSAGDKGYDAANSSGSNLGPTNQKFYDGLKGNIDAFLKDNPTVQKGQVPTDIVTGSGSGLDPHISPEAAKAQIDRVAKARGIAADQLEKLVETHVEGPDLGFLGESVVNVLLLNLDLDRTAPMKQASR